MKRTLHGLISVFFALMVLTPLGVSGAEKSSAPATDTPVVVAKEAYIYGYPVVEMYKTLYAQAIDKGGSNYRQPFNQIGNSASVLTPKDTAVITPNSDTPYSFVWMDLRAEPLVLTLPPIERNRYYSVQLIDLFTHNFAYLGTRSTGNSGGDYMIAGPGWSGETPKGIKGVIRSESNIAYALYRTQLFDDKDLATVKRIQQGYKVRPLSAFLGKAAPPAPPTIDWPAPEAGMTDTPALFRYLNFMLQFAPTDKSETALMQRVATIGVGPGLPFNEKTLSPDMQKALVAGIAEGKAAFAQFKKEKIDTHELNSGQFFGTRAYLKNNYMYRYSGAVLGIFGNSVEEAIYPAYFVDANGKPLDAASTRYTLHFDKDKLPPANAFWSVTMYDGKSKLLVDNPLNRYLINSRMLQQLKRDADGGITLYLQKDSPGKARESNWLPAPPGPFFAVLRLYMPRPEAVSGQWKSPPLQPVQ